MANLVPMGKDLATGEERRVTPTDILTDDAGTGLAGTQQSLYLGPPIVQYAVGEPSVDTEATDFTGFEEAYVRAEGFAASDQADIHFPGRLTALQTQIQSIKVGLKGTGDYQIKVYVEAAGPTWVLAYDSGVVAAPGALTEVTILAGALSAQPINSKRFYVVISCFVDATEIVNTTLPYVRAA